MKVGSILERLSDYPRPQLETIFNAILKSKPIAPFTDEEKKALSDFSEIILAHKFPILSLQDYADKIGYSGSEPTLEKIQDYALEKDWTIRDYPLSSYHYVRSIEVEFVLVKKFNKILICEC